MKIKNLLELLYEEAPLSWQEDYDNSGLNIGDPEASTESVLVCLDVTEAAIDEAIEKRCGLIISHHPLVFHGIKQLVPKGPVERAVIKAVRAGIAIAAMHTNLDNSMKGVNKKIAEKLGLTQVNALQPFAGRLKKLTTFCPADHAETVRNAIFAAGGGNIGEYSSCSFNSEGTGTFKAGQHTNPFVGEKGKIHYEAETRIETIVPDHLLQRVVDAMIAAHPYEEVAYDIFPLDNSYDAAGTGAIGVLEKTLTETELIEHIAHVFQTKVLRYSALTGKPIQKLAVCGGAGVFLLQSAIRAGADAFVTADVKYHDFFEADKKLLLIDAGHYETEQYTIELIAEILRKKIPNFAVHISEVNTNAVNYFSSRNTEIIS